MHISERLGLHSMRPCDLMLLTRTTSAKCSFTRALNPRSLSPNRMEGTNPTRQRSCLSRSGVPSDISNYDRPLLLILHFLSVSGAFYVSSRGLAAGLGAWTLRLDALVQPKFCPVSPLNDRPTSTLTSICIHRAKLHRGNARRILPVPISSQPEKMGEHKKDTVDDCLPE
ncbi:hypothetical protein B0F90DRAFT_619627 [Multifurca ochricompacta]|uniref:Uncharacterized protein n=1 Tax=Multifurca ochricompacta TaxID=376703 RepID=A0AAD4M353_9AGAM|nr:hypothetical protein B0F90DRAFT_619627 [Multifurca ochricompacta]